MIIEINELTSINVSIEEKMTLENFFDKVLVIPNEKHKYRDIFRNLLLIDKTSGLLILSYKSEEESVEDDLISGFLTAMDGFVSELGGSTNLREVAYKGFYIQAGYGENIKVALFLSKQADRILKERLAYFVKQFEENYEEQINLFKESGNISYFKNKEIIEKAKEILDI